MTRLTQPERPCRPTPSQALDAGPDPQSVADPKLSRRRATELRTRRWFPLKSSPFVTGASDGVGGSKTRLRAAHVHHDEAGDLDPQVVDLITQACRWSAR